MELSLMGGLLDMNHNRRFNAQEALMHEYFDDIRDSALDELIGKH